LSRRGAGTPDRPFHRSSAEPSAGGDRSPFGCGDRRPPDLGDLIVVLLAGSMAGLRDRLVADGYDEAAELVADLVELADEYIAQIAA
jgi:hypothetical protein